MGEEEGVVTPLGAEGLDRPASGLPGQAEPGGVPLAEVEAVGAGLGDEQMEQFKAGHKGLIPGVKSDLPCAWGDGGDGPSRHAPGEGLIGHLKGDAFAGLPEAGGEAEEWVEEQD